MSEAISPAQEAARQKRSALTEASRARCRALALDMIALIEASGQPARPSAAEILGRNNTRRVSNARRAIAYILRSRFECSYLEMAHALDRDHTSVIHLVQSAEACLERAQNKYCAGCINHIEALNAGLDAREGRG